MADRKSSPLESPPILTGVLIFIVMVFATVGWFGARPQMAALYGLIRDIQFPYFNDFIPYADRFDMGNLRRGFVPEFTSIYKNAAFYGLFTTLLTLGVMFVAMTRLNRNNIKADVIIKSSHGRSYRDVLERYADIEPSARFFYDYDVLDLPTNMGTARQNYTAMELLFYTGALRGVTLHAKSGQPPELDIDNLALRQWFVSRFGPRNPFYGMPSDRLTTVEEIEAAVDRFGWAEVLVLYPAMLRIYGFHVEDNEDGFKATNKLVERFISETWDEMNQFKKLYGEGITLGFADSIDREERIERHSNKTAQKPKKKSRKKSKSPEDVAAEETKFDAFTSTRSISPYEFLYQMGRDERESNGGFSRPIFRSAVLDAAEMRDFTAKAGKGKMAKPASLQFFGEVLSQYAQEGYLKSVSTARAKLKELLTSHLTQTTKKYPVSTGKDGRTIFAGQIGDKEQQAFNQKAQLRLNEFARTAETVLMRHAFQFGVIGAALNEARRSGILPPNLFRWMRFCDETTALWWFVHNVGMPSSVPENAGLFEHFQIEAAAGTAITEPYVRQALAGVKEEAERYLTKEMIQEIRSVLGNNAVMDATVKQGREAQAVIDKALAATFEDRRVPEEGADKKKGADEAAPVDLDNFFD